METIKGKKTVEVECTTYLFKASEGDYNIILVIENGDIQEISCWNSVKSSRYTKDKEDFTKNCYSAINIIVKQNPEELKNIYKVLKKGAMKDFCRELQQEKLARFDF